VEKRGAKASLSAALMKKINQQVLASPVLHGVFDLLAPNYQTESGELSQTL
jgi:hypothetical protein